MAINSPKKFISNIILTAAIGALLAFVVSLFLPKYWQVSGRIVVFPSGKPVSASQNLAEEVGNTAGIVNSGTFQKNNFGDLAASFSGAEAVKNSSIVLVKFESAEENIQMIEDLIVKIPRQIDEYARDLYDGSPFKYKILSDPEISARPVKPDMIKNVFWGFLIGFALYFLYWLFAESFFAEKKTEKESDYFPVSSAISTVSGKSSREPQIKETSKTIIEEKKTVAPEKKIITPISSAPDNLPISDASAASEHQEPSDEEVKERLNRLMKGEL